MTGSEIPIEAPPTTTEATNYPDIEEDQKPSSKGIYMLRIKKFVTSINPEDYFQTSGEALEKTEALIKDLQTQLKSAKKLYQQLSAIRGQNKYLETEAHKNGTILRIKNPRSAKAKPRKLRPDLANLTTITSCGDKLFVKSTKQDGVLTYCAINPDEETYSYFNSYNNAVNHDNIVFKPLKQDIKEFEEKLRSNGYKKVLL